MNHPSAKMVNRTFSSAQHDAYHSLRGTRTSMEELSLHLNKTLRDFIEEGHEKVGLLRTEDVAPALKIVTDYRYSYPPVSQDIN